MKKQTLSVETRFGTISRQTNRPYNYVVVSRGHSVEREREIIAGEIRVANHNLDYHRTKLAKGEFSLWNTPEQVERDIQRNLDRIASLEAEDPFERAAQVHEWGWSTRFDLAQVNVRKAQSLGYEDVSVFSLNGAEVF
jgi:hypothetical protein